MPKTPDPRRNIWSSRTGHVAQASTNGRGFGGQGPLRQGFADAFIQRGVGRVGSFVELGGAGCVLAAIRASLLVKWR